VPNAADEFHDYALEWLPESLTLSVDGVVKLTSTRGPQDDWQQWPFDHDMYFIMNLAIGGSWGKEKGPIDDSIFPVRMEFKYVRVYSPSPVSAGCVAPDPAP
jgi:beta-glucanase (GH16 family)